MGQTAEDRPRSAGLRSDASIRIVVENFGPIGKGEVSLRPLTIFVGASNSGKTYLSVLIYSLHNTLEGFSRIPVPRRQLNRVVDRIPDLMKNVFGSGGGAAFTEMVEEFTENLDAEDRPLRFSDLPEPVREGAKDALLGPDGAASDLVTELQRCFDLGSASALIRAREGIDRAKISLSLSEGEQDLWSFDATISDSGCKVEGKIEDMVLLPSRGLDSLFERIFAPLEAGQPAQAFDALEGLAEEKQAHYLPAARTGIMQSHRVIASSLIARAARAGLDRRSELPGFSGLLADFLQRLVAFDGTNDGFHRQSERSDAIEAIAAELEGRTLDGEIVAEQPTLGGYPEFLYRPRNAARSIRLGQASSMVTELAPMVLFLRDGIGAGDTLVFEEPEAHLHPAAQTDMAEILARLVNAGVRVVVTTHSDWLLKEIGNLIREGELSEASDGGTDGISSPGRLRPEDVGVWLFRKGQAGGGSTVDEIAFDRIEGVEPSDFEDVAEELYNRSAELQNRLAEAAADGSSE